MKDYKKRIKALDFCIEQIDKELDELYKTDMETSKVDIDEIKKIKQTMIKERDRLSYTYKEVML